ncbi:hypothetical protein [Halalkalicoccus paucihalophilus]|uniref:hypothetical protein n=1 Tax=Halalkalicoccus paucihalophilus TaxID=1008153 RepID=UPI0034A4B683
MKASACRDIVAVQIGIESGIEIVIDPDRVLPAGLVLNTRIITKSSAAVEGSKPHIQTVARVMDFLEKLGKDDVEQTKRRGKKLVVIDEEAADR